MKPIALTKVLSALAGLLVLLGASSAFSQAVNFQNYNAIIFNNLSTTSDIEGRTFVGNDITSQNSANLGIHLSSSIGATDRTLVVGGNISSGNSLNLQRGSLYIDGALGRSINFNGGGSTVVDHTIDATTTAIRNYSIAQSEGFRGMAADSVVTLPTNQPTATVFNALNPGSDNLAVFNVSASSIFSNPLGQSLRLDANIGTNVVINVSGTSVNWTSANMIGNFNQDYFQAHVLWNFYEATSISLNGNNFHGAILAPYASVTSNGVIDGLVVANNLTTQSEVHLPNSNAGPIAYEGALAPVPEPDGAILFLAAGAFVILVRNRRLAA